MSDPFDVDHDQAWSEAFGIGASHPSDADPVAAEAGADATTSAFDFEPDEVSSDEDYDFTGDGVVDHHDVHEVLTGFHDFHVDDADLGHDGIDHHGDPGAQDADGHLDAHDPGPADPHQAGHHDAVDGGGGHFAFSPFAPP